MKKKHRQATVSEESSTEQLSAQLLSEHSIVQRRKPAPGVSDEL